jgi:nitrogenase molybdenum-cofactor synthesis protein NifE
MEKVDKSFKPSKLEGRVLSCGAHSRERLNELFGLNDPSCIHKFKSVAWMDNHIEASIEAGNSNEIVFLIERKKPGIPCFFETEFLSVYYRGEGLPEDLDSLIRKEAPLRLRDYPVEKIAQIISEDPELGMPGQPMPPHVDDSPHPKSHLNTWGAGDVYADFFAGGELSRGKLDSIDLLNKCTFIQHSDTECVSVSPHTPIPMTELVHYPWVDRIRNRDRIRQERKPLFSGENIDQSPLTTTDLNEMDVIMGNPDKLKRVVDHVLSMKNENLVFLSCTCVPIVTGEDVESLVKICQKKSRVPFLFLTCTSQSMTGVFRDLLVTKRLKAEEKGMPVRPDSVNLIGFPKDVTFEEIRTLLNEAGISVNSILIPSMQVEAIEKLPEASLSVYYPNSYWQNLYDQILFESRIKYIMPEAPFGMKNSKAWFLSVAREFGREDRMRQVLDSYMKPYDSEWEEYKSQAQDYRLGYVVRSEEYYYLTDPTKTWAIPVINLSEEMGFGVDVFIKAMDRKKAYESASAVNATFLDPEKQSIKAFNSFEMMMKRLMESRCSAVLSNHFFDWRITMSGKNSFSLIHFEMGIKGAVATIKRLVNIARLPVYRRYSKYLMRTPEGLRMQFL